MSGLCECGCGEKTNIATRNRPEFGQVIGRPMRYVHNHHRRKSPVAYIVDVNRCFVWQRSLSTDGYPTVGIGNRRTAKAHVVAYVDKYGPVPEGHELHHTCRERRCVNPDHLQPVTRLAHRHLHPRATDRKAA